MTLLLVTAAEAASGVSDPTLERGLAFVSYQSSFHDGFRFIQVAWANNPKFVSLQDFCILPRLIIYLSNAVSSLVNLTPRPVLILLLVH